MSNSIQRLNQFIHKKAMSIAAFEKKIGMSNNSFGKQLKNNGAIGSDKLENILIMFPELNPDWLLTGNGNMIKGTAQLDEAGGNLTEEQKLKRSNDRLEEMLYINMQNNRKLLDRINQLEESLGLKIQKHP